VEILSADQLAGLDGEKLQQLLTRALECRSMLVEGVIGDGEENRYPLVGRVDTSPLFKAGTVDTRCPYAQQVWTAKVVAVGGHALTQYEANTAGPWEASNGPCTVGG
jgi:hypothetical protein